MSSARPPARRPLTKQQRRKEAARAAAEREAAAARRRRLILAGAIVPPVLVVAIVVAILVGHSSPAASGSSPAAAPGSSGLVAGLGHAAQGQTVDGIPCGAMETVTYHVHAHLAVYMNGNAETVPAGIGIPDPQFDNSGTQQFVGSGTCFYWLHAHTPDGIIHIEAPKPETFTLGQYFDLWGVPLSSTQVGDLRGPVTAFTCQGSPGDPGSDPVTCPASQAKPYTGDLRALPLLPHMEIQLDVGSSFAFQPYTFTNGL